MKYKTLELQHEAARVQRVHEATVVTEPSVRRQARLDVRLRRQGQHGHS
jgi:hypothetical protein